MDSTVSFYQHGHGQQQTVPLPRACSNCLAKKQDVLCSLVACLVGELTGQPEST
jgi:hypothetical protein